MYMLFMLCRFDAVNHFAGLKAAREKPLLYYDDNLIGTITLSNSKSWPLEGIYTSSFFPFFLFFCPIALWGHRIPLSRGGRSVRPNRSVRFSGVKEISVV
jgi:hypothetical protein